MKKIKGMLSIVVCVLIMLVGAIPAQAINTVDNLDDVANGVFKINMYIKGQEVLGHSRGSCFLINEDTIVTAAHCVDITNEEYYYLLKYYGINQDDIREKLEYSVTLTRDLTVKATLVNLSQEMDFAILKLDQPINGHYALALRDSKTVKRAERVYSVGFPGDKDQGSTWDESMAAYKEGIVNKAEYQTTIDNIADSTLFIRDDDGNSLITYKSFSGNVLELSADISSGGNSGGPIVDVNGKVVALCSCGDGTTNFVTAIDQVMSACDTLGINYIEADAINDGDDSEDSKPIISKAVIIGIVVVIMVAVAIAVVLVVVLLKKKKTSASSNNTNRFVKPQPVQPPYRPVNAPSGNNGSEGTTVLYSNNSDSNATTILGTNNSQIYLVRISNNERINITNPYFKLGKDPSRVDYCITGNSAISRFHAAIVSKYNQYFIVDNATTNHTYVNGEMISPNVEIRITNGAKIKMADEEFEFRA